MFSINTAKAHELIEQAIMLQSEAAAVFEKAVSILSSGVITDNSKQTQLQAAFQAAGKMAAANEKLKIAHSKVFTQKVIDLPNFNRSNNSDTEVA